MPTLSLRKQSYLMVVVIVTTLPTWEGVQYLQPAFTEYTLCQLLW